MSPIRRGHYESSGIKRRHFEYALIVAVVFFLLSVGLGARLLTRTTSNTQMDVQYTEMALTEIGAARDAASQISRIGGSTSFHLLAQTQQHLYALQQLNALSGMFIGSNHAIVPQELIDGAQEAVWACEEGALAAQVIDAPLTRLWEYLNAILLHLTEG